MLSYLKNCKKGKTITHYIFDFKGVYLGNKIEEVVVVSHHHFGLDLGQVYVLKLKMNEVRNGHLYATLLAYRSLINMKVGLKNGTKKSRSSSEASGSCKG